MKRRLILSSQVVAMVLLVGCLCDATMADGVNVGLNLFYSDVLDDQSGGTWELVAKIDSVGTADGSNGLSSVVALLDGIDFDGSATSTQISWPTGNGAINPIDLGGPNERVPAILLSSGTVELIYGQNLFDIPSVVPLVGTGVDTGGAGDTENFNITDPLGDSAWDAAAVFAKGSFSPGLIPSFGQDGSLFTDALFLNTSTGPFGSSIPPDLVSTLVRDNLFALVLGDANNDELVSALDFTAVQQNFGNVGPPNDGTLLGDANDDGLVSALDTTVVQQNFGNAAPLSASISTVPEPASITLMGVALVALVARRRRW